MITPTPAPQQPKISLLKWAGSPDQCPRFAGFPTRAGLPAGLSWSGKGEVPAIGTRVYIHMNGFGLAEVKAYFHAEGYLGVICQPDKMPAWLAAHGVTQGHFFGIELAPRKAPPQPLAVCEAREQLDRQRYRSQPAALGPPAFPESQR